MRKVYYSLGIETSCDETAAAVVNSCYEIVSNVVFSQYKLHASYFGVVPELASRTHYEKIHFVIEKAIKNFDIKKINIISYTEKPGLKGALLIGKTVAKTLGYIHRLPTVGVDHLWGHIFSVILTHKGKIKFPFISLIISGGHTELSLVYSLNKREVLGQTRDDAVGEAFDKVAKMLSERLEGKNKNILKYPGGPIIEKLSKFGDPKSIDLPRPYLFESYDFSFSGLKTAVLYYIKDRILNLKDVYNVCASFQEAVIDTLEGKVLHTIQKTRCKRVVISGGVSSNYFLRKRFKSLASKKNIEIYFPHKKLATDNAAMISIAGIAKFCKN
ncbi:MAG: tRNA (adenosine(37)-N6)-threonylcarbamoyltransferase complex transferase subunit TsaD [Endomicrobiia bacterium]